MQIEKTSIINDLLNRVNNSPFLLVADFTGLTVKQFEALRTRLGAVGSQIHVTKNSYVKRVVQEVGLPEQLTGSLAGQNAVVTGDSDVCGAAKVLKEFTKEFNKLRVKVGALEGKALDEVEVAKLADLPSREVLLSQVLGLLNAPATNLVRLINEPGSRLARVMKAHVDKQNE